MENITQEFTYAIADELYSQTTVQQRTARLTYNGPEKKYLIFDADTNIATGSETTKEQYDTQDPDNSLYIVEVDCNEETLVCAIFERMNIESFNGVELLEEEIDGNIAPVEYHEPPLPFETYDMREIRYNRLEGSFVKPFIMTRDLADWDSIIDNRNNALAGTDHRVTDDLPEALYTKITDYRNYLRDLPEIYGVSWKITIDNGGSGYAVGERLSINDASYKNDQPANEIIITITEVDDNGAITKFSKHTHSQAFYHPEAGAYNNVFYTSNSVNGSGAQISVSKIKLVPAHKVRLQEDPLG